MIERKVWEESWEVGPCSRDINETSVEIFLGQGSSFDEDLDVIVPGPRLRLAAAAPEMARLLLEVEFADTAGDSHEWHHCPGCGARRSVNEDGSAAPFHDSHRDDCRWVAVMRKAGVLE